MTCAYAFAIQLNLMTPSALRILAGLTSKQLPKDFHHKLEDLPDLNTGFGMLAIMQYIGGFKTFNGTDPFQATDTMIFQVCPETGLPKCVPDISSRIGAHNTLSTRSDFARKDIRTGYYIKLSHIDDDSNVVYHALSDNLEDKLIFSTIHKLWFIVRIHVKY